MSNIRGEVARRRNALRIASILALVVFASGCSTASWRSLELGDVLGVRGQWLQMVGKGPLEGGVGWAMQLTMLPQRSAPDVRRARFGVGTASRWTLIGALKDAAAWPESLAVSRAVWDVELATADRIGLHTFELDAGQTLTRIEPCDATACTYAFVDADAHRDVFAFEVVAGGDPSLDAWLDAVERGIEGRISLVLYVTIAVDGDPLPTTVAATIPLAPSGATLEFRP